MIAAVARRRNARGCLAESSPQHNHRLKEDPNHASHETSLVIIKNLHRTRSTGWVHCAYKHPFFAAIGIYIFLICISCVSVSLSLSLSWKSHFISLFLGGAILDCDQQFTMNTRSDETVLQHLYNSQVMHKKAQAVSSTARLRDNVARQHNRLHRYQDRPLIREEFRNGNRAPRTSCAGQGASLSCVAWSRKAIHPMQQTCLTGGTEYSRVGAEGICTHGCIHIHQRCPGYSGGALINLPNTDLNASKYINVTHQFTGLAALPSNDPMK